MSTQKTCSRGHIFTRDKTHPVCPKCWPGKYTKKHAGTEVIDRYIASFPEKTQTILTKIRATIRSVAPSATEVISYGIPTFDLNNKHLIHYAGFTNHVSIFPGSACIAAYQDKLSDYQTSKGTIQFPLNTPIPYALIRDIARYREHEMTLSDTNA